MDIKKYLKDRKEIIDEALDRYLPKEDEYPPLIHQAMRYSLFAGGKRIRPILTLASAETVSGKIERALPVACAIELIHTYSLIHDDLPSLDNDDLRRGKPTSHKRFGEAIAILAGDALLTYAFYLIATKTKEKSLVPCLVKEIASSSGSRGMIGGQTVDILSSERSVDSPILEYIHTHKTGSLIRACLRTGCILGGGSKEELRKLSKFGKYIGLAFQIADDILDVVGNEEEMGKRSGADLISKKITYSAIYGLNESKQKAKDLIEKGISLLDNFGQNAAPLKEIARFIVERSY